MKRALYFVFLLCVLSAFCGLSTPLCAESNVTPRVVDLRATFKQWGLPIKAQGSRDTCAVFTFTGALEYALAKGTGETGTRLSEEYLNWAANKVSDDDEDGASYEDLISAFDKWGICESSLMPYLSRYGSPEPTRDALNNAMQIWQLGFKRHWIARRTENGLDDSKLVEMKKVLASGWPLCAYGRDHSILLVGYQLDDKMPGGGQFITRNSATQRYETIYFEASKTEFGSVLWIDLPRRKSNGQA